jgi:lipid II:glycine glycyltransferase (peptidoglycan interpeptide bridge formation enzyme)
MTAIARTSPALVEELDEARWTSLAAAFLDHNYRQAWAYGRALAERQGAVSRHVAVCRDGQLLGLADVRVKRLPVIGGGMAYISGGPLTRQGQPGELENFAACLEALRDEFVHRQGLLLRVVAPLGDATWSRHVEAVFSAAGFTAVHDVRAYRTVVVDLQRSLPAIRAGLAQKWRNCLNQAERNKLEVVEGEDDTAFEQFERMFKSFVTRKGFDVSLGAGFFRQVQARATGDERLRVGIAKDATGPTAGILTSSLGDTSVYLLGATEEGALRTKAAYLLQWWAIQAAHARGQRWYDLGGIDPEGNAGVYHFKSGMGGEELAAAVPHEGGAGCRVRATKSLIRVYRRLAKKFSARS